MEAQMKRVITTITTAIVACCVFAPAASAHVTANPADQKADSFTKIEFRVPNERDVATTKIEIQIPEGVQSVSVQPVSGWTFKTTTTKLDEPIVMEDGDKITEAVSAITFSGGKVNAGEFQSFYVGMKLPKEGEVGKLLFFPTIQTYEGGEVVSWIDKPKSEDDDPFALDNPAPFVTLGSGDEAAAAKSSDDDDSAMKKDDSGEYASEDDSKRNYALAIAALALSVVSLLFGMFRGRRK
jgi:uncharacterized protein YcnI